ncbi:MAG: hypothetical protein H7A49_05010 [Akkermansiaceae bacterium]|nr:hypothetical protein [Akkermansiaceae bacterium]MCP5543248.1 hypothetical protein [Akkermansiaceae bacterium]
MKAERNRKIFSIAVVVILMVWLTGFTTPPPRGGGTDASTLLFTGWTFGLLKVLAFGTVLIIAGIRLYRALNPSMLKVLVGIVAFIATIWMAIGLDKVPSGGVSEDLRSAAALFLSCLLTIPLYGVAVRFLLPWIGGEKPAFRSLYGKGTALLVAILLWNMLNELLLSAAPKIDGSAHAPAFPWGLIAIFLPILAAVVIYRLIARFTAQVPG